MAANAKVARLDLRLTSAQRDLIERAAQLNGSTMAGYAISRLVEDASQVVVRANRLVLDEEDWDTFIAALDAPDGPKWHELRTRKRVWDDDT